MWLIMFNVDFLKSIYNLLKKITNEHMSRTKQKPELQKKELQRFSLKHIYDEED